MAPEKVDPIVREMGEKKAVLLPIEEYDRILEDLSDLEIIAEWKKEPEFSFKELKERLRKEIIIYHMRHRKSVYERDFNEMFFMRYAFIWQNGIVFLGMCFAQFPCSALRICSREQPPTPTTGTAMIPFLALASVSGGSTELAILKGIFNCYSPGTGFDWETAIALGAIGFILGFSVYLTVTSDLGYLSDAFT